MKTSLLLAAAFFAASLARADVVIVQNIDGMGQSAQMTVTVGPTKVRTDVNPQISMITNTATGDVTTIMRSQQSYMVTTAAMSKAMMASAIAQTGTLSSTPPAPVATGKTDKINGYDASEYTFSNGTLKCTYWICKDFPNAKTVTDALKKLQSGGLASITKGMTPDLSTFPGVPVKTEVEINGQKITTELVSATEQNIDPSQYEVPAGFTQIKMPTAPQQ
jgi:hypothetical protein